MPNHLFILGAARSGTTALVKRLNSRSEIALGNERYRLLFQDKERLEVAHFDPERFFTFHEGDTTAELWDDQDADRPSYADADWVGDKLPGLVSKWRGLAHLPGARFLCVLREPMAVARSFQTRAEDPNDSWPSGWDHRVGIRNWNGAVRHFTDIVEDGSVPSLVVFFEDLFYGGKGWDQIAEFLAIEPFSDDFLRDIRKDAAALRPTKPRPMVDQAVALSADFEAYRTLYARCTNTSGDVTAAALEHMKSLAKPAAEQGGLV